MLRKLELVLRVICMFIIVSCAVQITKADDLARAFAATYQLSDVVEDGLQVHLKMTLTLMNPRDEDVKDGIVALSNSQPNPVLLGSFGVIKMLPHRGQVTVSHTFTIAAAEYSDWQRGHSPKLQFLIPSGEEAVTAGIQAHEVMLPARASQ